MLLMKLNYYGVSRIRIIACFLFPFGVIGDDPKL